MKKCCWTCYKLINNVNSIDCENLENIGIVCDIGEGAKIEVGDPFGFFCKSYNRNPELEVETQGM